MFLSVHGSGSFHRATAYDSTIDVFEFGHLVGSAASVLRTKRHAETCAPTGWTVSDIQWEVAPRAPVQG